MPAVHLAHAGGGPPVVAEDTVRGAPGRADEALARGGPDPLGVEAGAGEHRAGQPVPGGLAGRGAVVDAGRRVRSQRLRRRVRRRSGER